MANMTLNSYIHQISMAWEDYEGPSIGASALLSLLVITNLDLLSLADLHCMSSSLRPDIYPKKLKQDVPSPLAEMCTLHFQVLDHLDTQKFDSALQAQCQLGQLFCKVLQSQKEENWALPIMEVICNDLRRVAITATINEDILLRSEENQPTCMERAADVIMALFRVCAADTRSPEPETKRWGMLGLVNHLFKIYFRINRLQLCKPLTRAIEAQAIKDRFPVSQMVTYRYYVGRKAMFDSDFKEADQCLTYAFTNTASYRTSQNKRKVLTYLIPVKMFLGWLPTEEALRKFDMLEFQDVAAALKTGNVRRFDKALSDYETIFIKAGIYLILEKLRMQLYRNLFKKVYLIYGNHQIPIQALETALRWAGQEEIDTDETHCITCNLIAEGQIRGYISYQHQMLVVAKQNAFPKLSTLNSDS